MDASASADWIASAREMPLRWSRELPDRSWWDFRAGIDGDALIFWWHKRGPGPLDDHGGGGGGPVVSGESQVQLNHRSQPDPTRPDHFGHASGQLTKDVRAVRATLDNGEPVEAEVLAADDLPVDLFVVVVPPGRYVAEAGPAD